MNWLVETLLANAVVATPLAVLAWVVGRCVRRPAVQHALWILVMAKLITPPLVSVSVTVPASWTGCFGVHPSRQEPTAVPAVRLESAAYSPSRFESDDASGTVGHRAVPVTPRRDDRNDSTSAAGEIADSGRSGGTAVTSAAAVTPLQIPDDFTGVPRRPALLISLLFALLIAIWCVGSLVWWSINARLVMRFGRQIRTAGLRDGQLQRRASDLGARLGLTRVPAVQIIDSGVAPMLWGCGKWTKIVLPAGLLDRLDAESRDALLLHELGHFRRRDHWVRLLELFVTGLYWWHPVVWWAKRRIAVHEEECCDALVVSQSPTPRRYAEVLLDTLDFLAEHRPRLLPAASAMSGVPLVERRLRLIMAGGINWSLSKWGYRGLICLFLLLPYQPLLMAALPAALTNDVEHFVNEAAATGNSAVTDALPSPERTLDVVTAPPRSVGSAASFGELRLPPPTEHPLLETGPSRGPWGSATSKGGRFQLTALSGGRVQLSDGSNGRTTDLTAEGITAAVFLSRDQLLAGTKAGEVRIYDAASAAAVSFLGLHRDEVTSVSLMFNGRRAVTASRDGSIFVWDLEANGAILYKWNVQQPISVVRASPDGQTLAVACGDWMAASGRVLLMDMATGRQQHEFPARAPIGALSFRSGDMLLTADWEGLVTFWDATTGELRGHGRVAKDTISAASFSSDTDALVDAVRIDSSATAVEEIWPGAILER